MTARRGACQSRATLTACRASATACATRRPSPETCWKNGERSLFRSGNHMLSWSRKGLDNRGRQLTDKSGAVANGDEGWMLPDLKGLTRARARTLETFTAKQVRIRFHDLRHTFASQLVLRGCSLKVVQELVGHHSVTMTERYAHIGGDQLVAAVGSLDSGVDEESGRSNRHTSGTSASRWFR